MWVSLEDDRAWTPEAHLIAHAVDALNGANWQRGDPKAKKPTPIPRPSDMAELAAEADRNLARAQRFLQRTKEG